ncbi:MAG: AMP-binding protein [Oscillospiraceae bacterium]|jgi:acetyl-CoA synthetase|nr:AMP-binding protein [Oscillospiraceae bacterium]
MCPTTVEAPAAERTPVLHKFIRTDFTSHEDFFANYEIHAAADYNFAYDVVDTLAAETPEKEAMVWCNDQGEEHRFTFADIKAGSDRYALALQALGIRKGDSVMCMLKRRYEFWFFIIACHKIGAVIIPATHMLTKKDIVYRVQKADVRLIISVNDPYVLNCCREAMPECAGTVGHYCCLEPAEGFEDWGALAAAQTGTWTKPTGAALSGGRDPLLAYFSSGTTGHPKMALHDHYYTLAHIATAKFWHGVDETDLHLTVADTGWGKAVWGKLYGEWICEATVFTYDYGTKFQPSDLLTLIDKYGITSFCAPPTIYRFFIKADLSKHSLKSLKKSTTAGEPLNPEVYNRWLEYTGLKVREGFGQTETVLTIANTVWMDPKPGSMGKPMPISRIDVYDPDGRLCDAGEEGELMIPIPNPADKPYGVFEQYFHDQERTDETVCPISEEAGSPVFYHSGDTAWRDEDGYIWFKGRNDDIIKSSGYRIGPFEVESALIEHPAVRESAITAVPDPVRGQIVKASIILDPAYTPSEELKKELQEHVKRVTAPYKYPRIIDFVTELPLTINGKIRRSEIKKKDMEKLG